MFIMNVKYLLVNYALFIRRLCLHVFVRRPRSPWTKRLRGKMAATKCPCGEIAGGEVSPRRNGCRRSVPETKRQATKQRRRNGCEKRRRRKGVYP